MFKEKIDLKNFLIKNPFIFYSEKDEKIQAVKKLRKRYNKGIFLTKKINLENFNKEDLEKKIEEEKKNCKNPIFLNFSGKDYKNLLSKSENLLKLTDGLNLEFELNNLKNEFLENCSKEILEKKKPVFLTFENFEFSLEKIELIKKLDKIGISLIILKGKNMENPEIQKDKDIFFQTLKKENLSILIIIKKDFKNLKIGLDFLKKKKLDGFLIKNVIFEIPLNLKNKNFDLDLLIKDFFEIIEENPYNFSLIKYHLTKLLITGLNNFFDLKKKWDRSKNFAELKKIFFQIADRRINWENENKYVENNFILDFEKFKDNSIKTNFEKIFDLDFKSIVDGVIDLDKTSDEIFNLNKIDKKLELFDLKKIKKDKEIIKKKKDKLIKEKEKKKLKKNKLEMKNKIKKKMKDDKIRFKKEQIKKKIQEGKKKIKEGKKIKKTYNTKKIKKTEILLEKNNSPKKQKKIKKRKYVKKIEPKKKISKVNAINEQSNLLSFFSKKDSSLSEKKIEMQKEKLSFEDLTKFAKVDKKDTIKEDIKVDKKDTIKEDIKIDSKDKLKIKNKILKEKIQILDEKKNLVNKNIKKINLEKKIENDKKKEIIDIIKLDTSECNEKKNDLLDIINDFPKSNSETLINLLKKDETKEKKKFIDIDKKKKNNNTFVVDLTINKKVKEE